MTAPIPRTYTVPPIGAELRDLAVRASKFGQQITHFDSLHWLVSLRVVDDLWTLRVAYFATRPAPFSLEEEKFWRKVATWRNVLTVPPAAPWDWDRDLEEKYDEQACAVLINWRETIQEPSQLALLPPTQIGTMERGW